MIHHLPLTFFLLCFVSLGHANTEIVNFDASPQIDANVSYTDTWPVLGPTVHSASFAVVPAPLGTPLIGVCSSVEDLLSKTPRCPHEIWIKLDLDADEPKWKWTSFGRFTLRISWPGSSPADFLINILNPEATATRFSGSPIHPPAYTRVKFARIRVVDTGVVSPASKSTITESRAVPFVVTLEPLYFGVLPASVVPVLWVLLAVVLVAAFFVVPYVNGYLQKVATDAKKDLAGKKE